MKKLVLIIFFVWFIILKKAKLYSNHVNESKIEKTCKHLTPSICDFFEMKRILNAQRKVSVTTRDLACEKVQSKDVSRTKKIPRRLHVASIINDSFEIFHLRHFLTASHGLRLIYQLTD